MQAIPPDRGPQRHVEEELQESDSNTPLDSPCPNSSPLEFPRHVALIMDGNGRWAQSRSLPRAQGHMQGAEALRAITYRAVELGIEQLTCFALSTENFQRRPAEEVAGLLELLRRYLNRDDAELEELGICLRFIGRRDQLPSEVQDDLLRAEEKSSAFSRMILRLAVNYGSRRELIDAARILARACESGERSVESLVEADLTAALYDPTMTDPDLLIRTAGEQRISNFLLWQISYSELYFDSCTWPEFGPDRFDRALAAYRHRRRKYGAIGLVDQDMPAQPEWETER